MAVEAPGEIRIAVEPFGVGEFFKAQAEQFGGWIRHQNPSGPRKSGRPESTPVPRARGDERRIRRRDGVAGFGDVIRNYGSSRSDLRVTMQPHNLPFPCAFP